MLALASTILRVFSLCFACFLFALFVSLATTASSRVSWATAFGFVAADSTAAATTATSVLTKSSAADSIGNADDEMDFRRAAPPLALRLDLTAGLTGAINASSVVDGTAAATAAADVVIGTVVGNVAGTVAVAVAVASSAAVDFFFPFLVAADASAVIDAKTASLVLVVAAEAMSTVDGGDDFEGNKVNDNDSSAIAKKIETIHVGKCLE